jgi:hypothetical protein
MELNEGKQGSYIVTAFTFTGIRHAFSIVKDKDSIRVIDSASDAIEFIKPAKKPQFDLQTFLSESEVIEIYKLQIQETAQPLVSETFIKQVMTG